MDLVLCTPYVAKLGRVVKKLLQKCKRFALRGIYKNLSLPGAEAKEMADETPLRRWEKHTGAQRGVYPFLHVNHTM